MRKKTITMVHTNIRAGSPEQPPKRRDLEHREQCALVGHIKARIRPNVFWCAIPNGGARSVATGARLKREGVRAGVPDLHFLIPMGGPYGNWSMALYLEMKTEKGRVSDVQARMAGEIEAAGGVWKVAYGLDEALELLEQYGVIYGEPVV